MTIEQWCDDLKHYLLDRYNKGDVKEKDLIMSLLPGLNHCINVFNTYEVLRKTLVEFLQGNTI